MQEKKIEQAIINYLRSLWAVVEGIQSWKIMIKKGSYNHMMTLQSKWACDIICYYNWQFIWIEVKKDQKEVDKWIRLLERYEAWEELPKSYQREKDQIEYRKKIIENGWVHIITSDITEIINYIWD